MKTRTSLLVLGLVGTLTAGFSIADSEVPDLDLSFAVTAASEPVSLYTLPSGLGMPFTLGQAHGGSPGTDATITLTVIVNSEQGDPHPVQAWPAEDMWLQSSLGGLVITCISGTCADGNTDINGETRFQLPLRAGGHSDPPDDLLQVYISGMPLNQPGFEIFINSPDIDGSGQVDLADVIPFAQVYRVPESYDYLADLWWDGVISLSDLVLFAQGYGAECP